MDRLYESDFVQQIATMGYLLQVDPLVIAKAPPFEYAFYTASARVYADIERKKAESAKSKGPSRTR